MPTCTDLGQRGGVRVGDAACVRCRRPLRRRDEAVQPRAIERVHPRQHHRRVPVPVRRGLQRAHGGSRRQRRPDTRSGIGVDRGCPGGVHLLDVSVPGADRRVHRGARPDPNRGRRSPPGARRVRQSDRATGARAPGHAAAWCAGCQHRERHVRLPQPRRRRRASGAGRSHRPDPGRATGCNGRRDRLGQDHSGSSDRPLRRPDDRCRAPRRRSVDRGRQRRVAHSIGRGTPGAVPVRRNHCRQPRLRPSDAELRRSRTGDRRRSISAIGWRHSRTDCSPRSVNAARSCRPASVSWWRSSERRWSTQTSWCSTRRRRRSTR